jgi:hypothetical protein
MNLSDVFKFTQGLGQNGHQIGRKVGDAIELLTLGMINIDEDLKKFLIVEDGVEGATSAKHKVEFSFYNLEDDSPSRKSTDLFGIIECKKVGVEQTIKQSFKKWVALAENKRDFHLTEGYKFIVSPSRKDLKWLIKVCPIVDSEHNIQVTKETVTTDGRSEEIFLFNCSSNSQILVALDVDNELHIVAEGGLLSVIPKSLKKCVVVQINNVSNGKVTKIKVNEALPGPQTPEKAKQASFVSLDVRKKVLGRFDKTDDRSFISVLVIGEASHWEKKSRSMVKLCNDYNLIVPDKILVELFSRFEEEFGEGYQEKITKTNYRDNGTIKPLVNSIIENHQFKVLQDMETGDFVKLKYINVDGKNRLSIETITD